VTKVQASTDAMWTGVGLGDGDGLVVVVLEEVDPPQAASVMPAPSTPMKRILLITIEAEVSQTRVL
jgi:hypothetical protein